MLRRLMIAAGAGYLAAKKAVKSLREDDKKKSLNHDEKDTLVQDPVCGIFLPKSQALSVNWKSDILYFCSDECKIEFMRKQKSKKGS